MYLRSRPPMAVCMLVAFFLCCCGASAAQQVDYTTADFTIPADPTRAVLHITITPMDMRVRSLTLFGDGRLELTDTRLGELSGQVEFSEVVKVVSSAVRAGLVEYDPMAIHARQLTLKEGKQFPPRPDATSITLLLGVDDYRRGSFEVDRVHKRVSLRDAAFKAKHFPQIPQFKATADLVEWMSVKFEEAESAMEKE